MNLFVADPDWGWWIIGYFFLGGIAAGSYFTATLIDLLGRLEDRDLARLGYFLAWPLILICGLFLILDLSAPERFWHMLFKSELIHAALEKGWPWKVASWQAFLQAPLFKYWSPMSVGSWALTLFGLCSTLSLFGSWWREGRLAYWFRDSLFGKAIAVTGCGIGFFIGAYPGALLSATSQPIWSDTVWIAPLFLTSAASTGIAALLFLAWWRGIGAPESLARLERADLWALVQELVVFTLFLISLGPILAAMLHTIHGVLFVAGTLLLGLLAPLALHLRTVRSSQGHMATAAVLALLGGFILRFGILTTPPELLENKAVVTAGFGPEDDRPPGSPGADSGNRSDR